MASKMKGGLVISAVLLLCLALGLPGAHAARSLAAAKEAPTGCINIVNNCGTDYGAILSYRNGKAYTARGYYQAPAGDSTGRICFPVMNRDYGFYVHFTVTGQLPSTYTDKDILDVNMPDPQGSQFIGGCALGADLFTTKFISGTNSNNSIFRNMLTGQQGTCAALGGTYIQLTHVYLEQETLTLC